MMKPASWRNIAASIEKYSNKRMELDVAAQKFQHYSDLLDAIETHGRYDIYIFGYHNAGIKRHSTWYGNPEKGQ